MNFWFCYSLLSLQIQLSTKKDNKWIIFKKYRFMIFLHLSPTRMSSSAHEFNQACQELPFSHLLKYSIKRFTCQFFRKLSKNKFRMTIPLNYFRMAKYILNTWNLVVIWQFLSLLKDILIIISINISIWWDTTPK